MEGVKDGCGVVIFTCLHKNQGCPVLDVSWFLKALARSPNQLTLVANPPSIPNDLIQTLTGPDTKLILGFYMGCCSQVNSTI